MRILIIIMISTMLIYCASKPEIMPDDYCKSIAITALACQLGNDIELPTAYHVEACILGIQMKEMDPREFVGAVYAYCREYIVGAGK